MTRNDKRGADAVLAASAMVGVLCLPAIVPVDGASLIVPEVAEGLGWSEDEVFSGTSMESIYTVAEPIPGTRDILSMAAAVGIAALAGAGAGIAVHRKEHKREDEISRQEDTE